MALTVFDSEIKEWRWGEYKSKSERIGKNKKAGYKESICCRQTCVVKC